MKESLPRRIINKITGNKPTESQGAYRIDPWPTLEQIRQRELEIGDPRERIKKIRQHVRYADAKTLNARFGPK